MIINAMQKNITQRFNDYCKQQEGQEFLWYCISFITLIGSIMPLALIAMYYTPWFLPFTFFSMLLFFSNLITIIGKMPIKTIIMVYLFTVLFNITVPIISLIIA